MKWRVAIRLGAAQLRRDDGSRQRVTGGLEDGREEVAKLC